MNSAMFAIDIRWRGPLSVPIPVTEVWLAEPGERWEAPRPGAAILRSYGLRRRVDVVGRWRRWNTLLTTLASVDGMLGRLPQTLRNDIRRGLDRDGLRVVDDWTPQEFFAFYQANDPANPARCDVERLVALRAAGRLGLRAMFHGGTPLCAHAYVLGSQRVLLLHSYSRRKASEGIDAAGLAMIGRANKALHWDALSHYARLGLAEYDWGGFSGTPGYGPDQFKQRFGPRLAEGWMFDTLVFGLRPAIAF